ncbi:hypothetical protein K402DRAFT_412070 [Aulographum hederae CBS 113979]|uniref:Uncharacterized protein n=1 Tax=Aulographum hederae CBS 113979 TaxID=1176131 RepID=A0A6G1H306_9PEZI|nr:hypothetical protein K402DRAFT_412070 [Aulographum hederae CBS 113979]
MSYHITEPHPSVPNTQYMYAGRGGAGNVKRVDPTNITSGSSATGPASRAKLTPPPSSAYFTSGRGGAGNVHREKERAIFSFDEELERQRRLMENQAPVYHVGRGGAGNLVDDMYSGRGSHGSASSQYSADSNGSHRARKSFEGAWNKVSRSFSKV